MASIIPYIHGCIMKLHVMLERKKKGQSEGRMWYNGPSSPHSYTAPTAGQVLRPSDGGQGSVFQLILLYSKPASSFHSPSIQPSVIGPARGNQVLKARHQWVQFSLLPPASRPKTETHEERLGYFWISFSFPLPLSRQRPLEPVLAPSARGALLVSLKGRRRARETENPI